MSALTTRPAPKQRGKQDLRERTKNYGIRIVTLFRALPRTTEAKVIGSQLLRSGTSIGAHYRETCRARSNAEFLSKTGQALQELDESEYWLSMLVDTGVMPGKRLNPLIDETNELIAIFVAMANKAATQRGQ